jgi:serine/threonine-protein kinase
MPTLTSGTKLGMYEIIGPIGAGGMGTVYRARDTRLPREAAIKVSAERFSDRFAREAHAISSLNHPNITTLYDIGPDYLVMELVDGPTLAERISQGPLSLEEAAAIGKQIADALDYAHERGIVHRDLKPGNVKIRRDGVVKVLDFGLAKASAARTAAVSENAPTMTAHQTEAGVIVGTFAYMAPEQLTAKEVDKRADIWASCCCRCRRCGFCLGAMEIADQYGKSRAFRGRGNRQDEILLWRRHVGFTGRALDGVSGNRRRRRRALLAAIAGHG